MSQPASLQYIGTSPKCEGMSVNDCFDGGWYSLTTQGNMVGSWVGGFFALTLCAIYAIQIATSKVDQKKYPETQKIANDIANGAKAFLVEEYKWLAGFCVVMSILLVSLPGLGYESMLCFLFGAILSASAGWMGMWIATLSNIRTTIACTGGSLNAGLRVAFKSGSVMAYSVVAFALLGINICYSALGSNDNDSGESMSMRQGQWEKIAAFAFGGSSIALFARVGGGIYTKAADVGADLVGKVEEDLAEDSPDNPATIADNVGDNVGDVAGMGADLFESYSGSLIAAATLGIKAYGNAGIAFPFWLAGFGVVCSFLGSLMVRTSDDLVKGDDKKAEGHDSSLEILESLIWSMRYGIFGASALVLGSAWFAIGLSFGFDCHDYLHWRLWATCVIGILCGNLIGVFTEYATSYTYEPTKSIARKSSTGPATVIIQGLGVGMLSCVPPVFFIFCSILGAFALVGVYGIAICAVAMLSTLGVTLATDAFGPVADNAGGIAEMTTDEAVTDITRETTDSLDALGNTTAATGKGFAIGSAVLTALALMNAFAEAVHLDAVNGQGMVDILDEVILPGIILGAAMPFVFAALTMLSVGKSAESIMYECRDQLNKKHFENTPLDYQKCVMICTDASIREMMPPGLIAVFCPVIVGLGIGPKCLLGMLAGAISSGFLMGVMMSNAGGAWDNAKKYVEKGNLGKGRGKGSDSHSAVVVGDTVGDPFKDTSGPSLNILIKLMSIISLVIAPLMVSNEKPIDDWEYWWVGVIILILVSIVITLCKVYFNSDGLHDKAAIDQLSVKRKGGDVEMQPLKDDQKVELQVKDSSNPNSPKESAPLTQPEVAEEVKL